MGLFSFLKDVGEKLGIGSSDAAPPAEDLRKSVEKLGLEAEGLEIKVEGDKVKVTGMAPSSSVREKIILALGNVTGVGAVDEDIAVKTREPDAIFYEVKKGDTLWKIAETHYGKGKGASYTVIFEANRPMLTHPDKIYPGQVLRIPPM
ncbi:BON domain-containing protein [Tepidamorphus gemmatus]|jgi:nucleoid-associated protein YgaU|uniref:BON domain-containing protein n=1 Tax=Tepidamorphus gemmatus TaxID=747076 RepID=A0A4R3MLJ6_9HYPH|nr:peptidoglycan-binding protein LysM [Tepidamorphus gemmatus]TCT13678.1 BON domain-containing protein [Tepidamorphus gemmatus]